MSDNRPVRIGDIVKLITPNLGYNVGAYFKIKTIDVINNVVGMRHIKNLRYTDNLGGFKQVKLQDIEIVSSPEWQLKLL